MIAKKCSKCGIEKPATFEYFNHVSDRKSGMHSICKICANKYHREYRNKNIEKARKRAMDHWWKKGRDRELKRRYGIGLIEKESMINNQNNKCAMCGIRINLQSHIDHDKKVTEKWGKKQSIRGILCTKCNKGIGLLSHNPLILIKGAKYITKFKEKVKDYTT